MPWQPFKRKGRHRRLEEEFETSFTEELLPRSASDGNLVRGPSERLVHGRSYGTGGVSNVIAFKEFRDHLVEEGETLAGLSLKYNLTIQDIKSVNKIWTNDGIWPGRILKIPVVESDSANLNGSGDGASCPDSMSLDSQGSGALPRTDSGSSSRMTGLALEGEAASNIRSFNSSPVSLPIHRPAPPTKMSSSASSSSLLLPGLMPHRGSIEDLSSFLSAMDSSIEINKKASISLIKSSQHSKDNSNNNS